MLMSIFMKSLTTHAEYICNCVTIVLSFDSMRHIFLYWLFNILHLTFKLFGSQFVLSFHFCYFCFIFQSSLFWTPYSFSEHNLTYFSAMLKFSALKLMFIWSLLRRLHPFNTLSNKLKISESNKPLRQL